MTIKYILTVYADEAEEMPEEYADIVEYVGKENIRSKGEFIEMLFEDSEERKSVYENMIYMGFESVSCIVNPEICTDA